MVFWNFYPQLRGVFYYDRKSIKFFINLKKSTYAVPIYRTHKVNLRVMHGTVWAVGFYRIWKYRIQYTVKTPSWDVWFFLKVGDRVIRGTQLTCKGFPFCTLFGPKSRPVLYAVPCYLWVYTVNIIIEIDRSCILVTNWIVYTKITGKITKEVTSDI